MKYRIYAEGRIVEEEGFDIEDNSLPYYDDYEEIDIPEALIDHITDRNL